eukprot:scaffold98810_cov69-Phaeocystis_antarctica.AAC.2
MECASIATSCILCDERASADSATFLGSFLRLYYRASLIQCETSGRDRYTEYCPSVLTPVSGEEPWPTLIAAAQSPLLDATAAS